jgi:hypothetical protein
MSDETEYSLRRLAEFTSDALLCSYDIGACMCVVVRESELQPGRLEVDAAIRAVRARTAEGGAKIEALCARLRYAVECAIAEYCQESDSDPVDRPDLDPEIQPAGERPKA